MLFGDGGFVMLLGELFTFKQFELLVKIVVFNNLVLVFVELEMKVVGIVNVVTGFENFDFGVVVRVVGLYGVRVECSAELEGALCAAFVYDGFVVVDVVIVC